MIGLTIGTGDWKGVAERSAAQMQKMTGIECHVISKVDKDLVHPSWHKLNLLRDHAGESLLIFDADIWCQKRWNPASFLSRGIAMAPEPRNASIAKETALYGLPAGKYYNAGLIICDNRSREVFHETKKLHPYYGTWLEQTALNRVIMELGTKVTELPLTYNHLISVEIETKRLKQIHSTNLHFAGRKTVAQLHAVFDALEATQPQPDCGLVH